MNHKNLVNQLQSRLHSMSNHLLAVSLFIEDTDSPEAISQEEFELIKDRVNSMTNDLVESREITHKLLIQNDAKGPAELFGDQDLTVIS